MTPHTVRNSTAADPAGLLVELFAAVLERIRGELGADFAITYHELGRES